MKYLMMYWCLWFHKMKIVAKSRGGNSSKVQCSCGRFYGMNDDARAFLPLSDEMDKFFNETT